MTWLAALDRAIETRLDGLPGRDLAAAAARLSERYRGDDRGRGAGHSAAPGGAAKGLLASDAERLAYLAVRAPATGAAVRAVLRELQARRAEAAAADVAATDVLATDASVKPVAARQAPVQQVAVQQAAVHEGPIRSLLDLGAGPGVGLWAALDQIETLASTTLVERDAASVALGQALAREAGVDDRLAVTWRRGDLRDPLDVAPHDLVLLSYSIGELDDAAALTLLDAAWHLTRTALVIVEPGTPRHFARLLALRQRLIDRGAHIAAPCPHARACPMTAPDWCHFAARLGRTSLHRRLKQGALSYEDEKYSYIIALREEARPAFARVVRRPAYHKGFVRLPLCGDDGLTVATVTRSQRGVYRAARDASWGDAWDPRATAAAAAAARTAGEDEDEHEEAAWPNPDVE